LRLIDAKRSISSNWQGLGKYIYNLEKYIYTEIYWYKMSWRQEACEQPKKQWSTLDFCPIWSKLAYRYWGDTYA
jgi:hypothetical protein